MTIEVRPFVTDYAASLNGRVSLLEIAQPIILTENRMDNLGVPYCFREQIYQFSEPEVIEEFIIDNISYNEEETQKSFPAILRDRVAHCFESAAGFAYPLLYLHGYNPRLVYINADPRTDSEEHAVTVFRIASGYGSLGRDGVTGYGWRPPIFPSFDHLMSSFYNRYTGYTADGHRLTLCMKGYTDPIDLVAQAGNTDWFWREGTNALEDFWYHCTDNVMCTEVITGNQYPYPPYFGE